jgi:hypothetical protein
MKLLFLMLFGTAQRNAKPNGKTAFVRCALASKNPTTDGTKFILSVFIADLVLIRSIFALPFFLNFV